MTHTGSHQQEPLGLDAPHCIPAEHIHVEQCCRAGAAEGRASVRSEAEVKAEALEEAAVGWDNAVGGASGGYVARRLRDRAAALRAAERAEGAGA